ncbi:MAG: hypothetical protein KBC62_01475 [Candidatus Pacebacteria bacterium]|nr:hypothetical protein [Candidatus Paceibacterota bacterium]MBP9842654.1 hypothetical protein [Candidatus Paceibacterota bacterium]
MNSVTKNIVTILGVLTIAFAGYYFFSQQASMEPVTDDFTLQQMLASTEVFIVRSQELDQMNFDLSVFEDARFKTLRSFTNPVQELPVGRTDPFSSVGGDVFISSESETE